MHIWSVIPLLLFIVIYYAGKRGQQAFAKYISTTWVKFYWAIYLLLASSYLIARNFPNGSIGVILNWVGSYSLAFFFYAFFILIIIDIIRLFDYWLGFVPNFIKQSPVKVACAAILLLVGLLVYGSWNARNPVLISYEINVPKNAGEIKQVHAIMISDLHLGKVVNKERLAELVQQINARNPDLILLAGDIIDGDIRPFVEQNMGATLLELKPRLGTYMALGNHDGHGKEIFPILQAAGVSILTNQYQLINNSFYVVGRDYGGHQGAARSPRPALADIMTRINKELPIILLNHSPTDLDEAIMNGVDLQLSGHTHQGQMLPNNFITQRMYEIDWGYLRKGDMQVIVSTGFGTWGPPIRIGNTPEVVDLIINFK